MNLESVVQSVSSEKLTVELSFTWHIRIFHNSLFAGIAFAMAWFRVKKFFLKLVRSPSKPALFRRIFRMPEWREVHYQNGR